MNVVEMEMETKLDIEMGAEMEMALISQLHDRPPGREERGAGTIAHDGTRGHNAVIR